MSLPGKCTSCHRRVLVTWHVDGTKRELCSRCLAEALEVTRSYSLDEMLRRLRGRE